MLANRPKKYRDDHSSFIGSSLQDEPLSFETKTRTTNPSPQGPGGVRIDRSARYNSPDGEAHDTLESTTSSIGL